MAPSPDTLLSQWSSLLNTPLLELGSVTITPLWGVKLAAFVVGVFVLNSVIRKRVILGVLSRRGVDRGIQYATARIFGYSIWVVAAVIALPMLGVQLQSLFVALGAVGLGIGLGLQKIAENFVSGLILLFGRPVKVGDRLELDGVEGTVEEIRARITVVRTNENVVLLLPNSELVSERVTNLTHNNRFIRFSFPVGVSYEADPKTVRDLPARGGPGQRGHPPRPTPDVLLTGFGDSSVDFELRGCSASKVALPHILRSDVYFAIWYKLQEAGIEIPFPQRDLHVRSMTAAVGQALRSAG